MPADQRLKDALRLILEDTDPEHASVRDRRRNGVTGRSDGTTTRPSTRTTGRDSGT